MTTLCSSVTIIIVHIQKKIIADAKCYCNPFIIFIMYVLSWITIIYTQHITNTIQIIIVIYLKSLPCIKYQYCTILYSILQCNISLPHDIYCDSGLPYYTRLNTLTKHIFILCPSTCNDDVLFLSYNHQHI